MVGAAFGLERALRDGLVPAVWSARSPSCTAALTSVPPDPTGSADNRFSNPAMSVVGAWAGDTVAENGSPTASSP